MKAEVKVFDDEFLGLYNPEEEVKLIAADVQHGEGPTWHAEEQCLYYSEIAASRTMKYSEDKGVELAFNNGVKANGMCVASDGRLLMCEHATSTLTIRNTDGLRRKVLADYYGDVELNSPNDVIQRSDGLVFFTDPIYGRGKNPGNVNRLLPSSMRPVYNYNLETGVLTLIADGFENPNGLCLSPDEKILYVADTTAHTIVAFDLNKDGNVKNPRLFTKTQGNPDGMKIDSHGNLLAATLTPGLEWYSPEGKLLGVISLPDEALNIAWGGEDYKTLYVLCRSHAYRMRTLIAGENYMGVVYKNIKRGV